MDTLKPLLLTEANAAKLVGLSQAYLRNRRYAGSPLFPYRKIGGKPFYLETEIVETINSTPIVRSVRR